MLFGLWSGFQGEFDQIKGIARWELNEVCDRTERYTESKGT